MTMELRSTLAFPEIAPVVVEFLCKHHMRPYWYRDRHYDQCGGEKTYAVQGYAVQRTCPCCNASKAMSHTKPIVPILRCEYCVTTWRLAIVAPYMKDVVIAFLRRQPVLGIPREAGWGAFWERMREESEERRRHWRVPQRRYSPMMVEEITKRYLSEEKWDDFSRNVRPWKKAERPLGEDNWDGWVYWSKWQWQSEGYWQWHSEGYEPQGDSQWQQGSWSSGWSQWQHPSSSSGSNWWQQ